MKGNYLMCMNEQLVFVFIQQYIIKEKCYLRLFIMPPFGEEGVYCFANVGRSVCLSVGRPNGFR